MAMLGSPPERTSWLASLRRYALVSAALHPVWELAHLPFYTIWDTGTFKERAFAVLHCSLGDLMIASLTLLAALLAVGNPAWPERRAREVALLTVGLGVGYTIFSEWMNTVVRQSWTYSPAMPVLPFFGTGLSPTLQWMVIPGIALWAARRRQPLS